MSNQNSVMRFSIFDCIINVTSSCQKLSAILEIIYGAMKTSSNKLPLHINYTIGRSEFNANLFYISRPGISDMLTDDIGEFIFLFEKDMTIELQKLRSDLYFLHAAALEYEGNGIILTAASGAGKSTASWGLLNSGFNYLSDELAPIDLSKLHVHPYPHALCLKNRPPYYTLPDNTLVTSSTLHVPIYAEPIIKYDAVPLKAVYFIQYSTTQKKPVINTVSTSLATAKIYSNTLNALGHKGKGLDAALSISSKLPCYELITSDLKDTCALIKSSMGM